MGNRLFTHFSDIVNYSVEIAHKISDKFYHLNELFEGREDSLRKAYRENQLSPGEMRGLDKFLDNNLDFNRAFST